MSQFKGKTAIITGGAEGIGFNIAKALAKQGMNLVIGDIDSEQLITAQDKLTADNANVVIQTMDVTQPAHWQQVADIAIEHFGSVHMLVNNAGVGAEPNPIEKTNHTDWRWVMDVNLHGVVYGMEAIVPLIKQAEGGWVVNVASMAGMMGTPFAGPYTASKVAVVGMSESWLLELAPANIHVSVLCPGFVRTRIAESGRNRQSHYNDDSSHQDVARQTKVSNHMNEVVKAGIDPELVGERVVEALTQNEFYIFTHPSYRELVQMRSRNIDDAFERAAQSPLLQDINEPDIVASFMK